jgi:hypothetical protein
MAEDILICTAWKKISLDPAVGTEQPKDAYWRKMNEFFDARNMSWNELTEASIHHRWGRIFMDGQKWSGCLSHLNTLNPSGTNDKDRVSYLRIFSCVYLHYFASLVCA